MAKVTGGEKIVAALRVISEKVSAKTTLRAGFLENSTYPDGTSTPMVAAIQEFGAPSRKIPPRPFMRNAVAAKSADWGHAVGPALKAADYDAAKALDQVGYQVDADIRDSIIATVSPPLSPVTVMLRGMRYNDPSLVVTGKTVGEAAERVKKGKTNYGAPDTPLRDTGHMLASVDHDVKSL